jgi:hypothetical protein
MRLLNTATLKPEEFIGSNVPEYVILSHPWGPGEVSLQELNSGEGKNKAGYGKILDCCQKAVQNGYEYVWIDTCW